METSELLTNVSVMLSKFLSVYSENLSDFVSDAYENLGDIDNAESLIYRESAPLNAKGFHEICEWLSEFELSERELIMINFTQYVSKVPTNNMFNVGGITFRSGRAYVNECLNIFLSDGTPETIYKHSIVVIDNYAYDFITGINGISVPLYIRYLYKINKTVGIDIPHSSYVGIIGKDAYLAPSQYSAMGGVIGPNYKQYTELRRVDQEI